MSHRHLPAGQPMPGGGGGIGPAGGDMGPGPGPMHAPHGSHGNHGNHGSHGGHAGPRRRPMPPHAQQQPYQYQPHAHHGHAHAHGMYAANYMNPYAGGHFYQQLPPHYQNGAGAMPSGYMHYQQPYMRSPPSMQQQFVPMAGVSVAPSYSRQHQPSPALATPYQPPPVPNSIPPQTPTSTHSSQFMSETPIVSSQPATAPPSEHGLPVQQTSAAPSVVPETVAPAAQLEPQLPAQPETEPVAQTSVSSPEPAVQTTEPELPPAEPFRAPLPWLSRPDLEFPQKRRTRRKRRARIPSGDQLMMPAEQPGNPADQDQQNPIDQVPTSTAATASTPSQPSGQAESQPTSKDDTRPGTSGSNNSVPENATRLPSRPAVPPVPIIPAMPKTSPKTSGATTADKQQPADEKITAQNGEELVISLEGTSDKPEQEETTAPKAAPRAPPSSWSALFSKPTAAAAAAAAVAASKSQPDTNGTGHEGHVNGTTSGADQSSSSVGPALTGISAIAAALQGYRVGNPHKVKFIEPRGLINIGNMCYMNSVLQVLLFCTPFYDFLDHIAEKVPLSFNSQTPILDAMILFMKEFQVIGSGQSAANLRKTLKNEELEQYGASFTPEFIYQAIEPDKRFENMRRGHQQDAEEFFGMLLQSLDEECAKMMGVAAANAGPQTGSEASVAPDAGASDGWLEVGAKQRAAVTRSSGASSSTPISQIFGGLLRSELRVTGKQNSITTEPYQALQLDIGAPEIRNVVDALIKLTLHEKLEGASFGSPRGKHVTVTKQTLIETLPPILILHLKRFQFDAEGGTTKIWKKVGYPLDLEIPAQALSKQWHLHDANKGVGGPKYRLIAVVYHHGKQANGGHYTVDVRRQDEQEWIRLDDTVIRRVRSQDVAEVGEEEPTKGAGQGPGSRDASTNRFGAMNDEDSGDRGEWTAVDKSNGSKNKWSSVVNGAGSQPRGKQTKENIKDNKVAYLLFYQRV